LALDGGGWSASRTDRFIPGKDRVHIVMEGWVGPTAGQEGCGKSRPSPRFDAEELVAFQKGIPF